MDNMKEINWSSVARESIKKYIELRENPDMSPLLENLRRQKGQEYVKGRDKANSIVNFLGYRKFSLMMKKYEKKVDEIDELEMRGPPMDPWESLPTRNDILQKILNDNKLLDTDVSDAFLNGINDMFIQIRKRLVD